MQDSGCEGSCIRGCLLFRMVFSCNAVVSLVPNALQAPHMLTEGRCTQVTRVTSWVLYLGRGTVVGPAKAGPSCLCAMCIAEAGQACRDRMLVHFKR